MVRARAAGRRRGTLLAFAVALLTVCHAPLAFVLAGRLARSLRGARGVWRGSLADAAVDVAYEVGDRVKAKCSDDERWYPGRIAEAGDDGTWVVRWNDPDGGPETEAVSTESLKKVVIFDGYQVGDECRAISPDDFRWYPGSVVEVLGGGTFRVKWDDPGDGDDTSDIEAEHMQRSLVFKGYKPSERVLARYPDDGQMYDATVVQLNDDGTFQVRWNDPYGGPEESPVHPAGLKYPPIPFDKLEVGQKHVGTVKSITDFGAWVDIGAESRGLLHISRIAKHRVESVYDYLDEGQEVDVWICGLREGRKFGLTMVEGRFDADRAEGRSQGDLEPFVGISPDEWLVGVVQGIRPYGVFVTVVRAGSTARGLVHVSRLSDGFVEDIESEFRVGQQVKVRVIDVDMTSGKMGLTMQSLQPSKGVSRSKLGGADLSVFQDPSEWVAGEVVRIVPFGAFVDVRAPGTDQTARGLLHISQIKQGERVESVNDELHRGQEVSVRVVGVDAQARKMELTMLPVRDERTPRRAQDTNPWGAPAA